jgi:UDP-N-acetylglucosamine--N-acetylmuramyl-(pentapeptide) pyrophosphoryl-undecaprenol N-acetylglucosamine transferase
VRLLICAGGTGGGVYPALAVLETLKSEGADVQTFWVGGEGGMEAGLVKRTGIPYGAIPAAGVHGVGLGRLPGNLWRLARGVSASRRILQEYRPDVLLLTGGYVAVPMAAAAASTRLPGRRPGPSGMRRVPILLCVPDIEPGLALRTVARFADRIALTAEDSRRYFRRSGRAVVTGYPTRPALAGWRREQARRALNLSERTPVVLVLGGSKGARSINRAVLACLPGLLELAQVVHVTGQMDWGEVQAVTADMEASQVVSARAFGRYHPAPYLHDEMGAALAAADLVLSRAGASILGEYPLFGLPSILVPYPHAWRYQKVNADHLISRGAAVQLADESLQAELLAAVRGLLGDLARLDSMRRAAGALAAPEAASRIGQLLLELAGERT